MSTFDLTNITIAGAYANATKAAQKSDALNAARHIETGESRNTSKSLWALVRRAVAVVAEMRPASSRLTSRPV